MVDRINPRRLAMKQAKRAAQQPRDARGHFVNRKTWEAAYRLAKLPVPKRVGARNAVAPLARQDVERAARQHKRLPVLPSYKAVSKPKPKGRKRLKGKPRAKVPRTESLFRTGQEFELTARYKPKVGQAAVRTLHLKMRVTLTSAMTKADAQALLDRSVRDGVVPPGIEVHGIDWSRGTGNNAVAGSDSEPSHRDLRNLYSLIQEADNTRFAPVAMEDYEDEFTDEEEE